VPTTVTLEPDAEAFLRKQMADTTALTDDRDLGRFAGARWGTPGA